MKPFIWLLDPGHGIETPGKRSPEVPPGFCEWDFNRDMVKRIIEHASQEILAVSLVSGDSTVPLRERVRRANMFLNSDRQPVLISVHSNAAGKRGWSIARGNTVFIKKNPAEESTTLAELFAQCFQEIDSSPWRGVRHRNFQMIRGPKMPAVLLELGFMTSKEDMVWLNGPNADENRNALADQIVHVMRRYQERGNVGRGLNLQVGGTADNTNKKENTNAEIIQNKI